MTHPSIQVDDLSIMKIRSLSVISNVNPANVPKYERIYKIFKFQVEWVARNKNQPQPFIPIKICNLFPDPFRYKKFSCHFYFLGGCQERKLDDSLFEAAYSLGLNVPSCWMSKPTSSSWSMWNVRISLLNIRRVFQCSVLKLLLIRMFYFVVS